MVWDGRKIEAGDIVVRLLSSARVPMRLRVTAVDEKFIYCGNSPLDADWTEPDSPMRGEPWMFDRATGVEEDERFGWGVASGVSGSWLERKEGSETDASDTDRETGAAS